MLVGIHHTALSTPDLDRLIAFYRDHFGFALDFDFSWDESNAEFQRTHAGKGYKTKTEWDNELFLAPGFFHDLSADIEFEANR